MTDKQIEALKLAKDLRSLADRFSEGWHDGIKIDASDILLLSDAAEALAEQDDPDLQDKDPELVEQHYKQVVDDVRKVFNAKRETLPAQQQEPIAWMKDCADFWEHYTYISEASQENYKAEAQMWVEKLRKSPPASKPWVGLSTVELDEIDAPIRERGHATVAEIYRAIEAKLREKNT